MADAFTYDPTALDTEAERDRVNTALRASTQWRQAIGRVGANPDGPLHLSKGQQRAVAAMLGLPTSDFHIDPAGNINTYHGWKGLPTWAKVAIGGGVTAASLGLVPGVPGIPGLNVGGGAGGGATGTSGGVLASREIGSTIAGGSLGMDLPRRQSKSLWDTLKPFLVPGAAMGFDYLSSRSQASAARDAGELQAQAAERAAQLQAEAFDKAIAFERERLAQEREQYEREWQAKEPYRQIGTRAIGTLRGLMFEPGPAPFVRGTLRR